MEKSISHFYLLLIAQVYDLRQYTQQISIISFHKQNN